MEKNTTFKDLRRPNSEAKKPTEYDMIVFCHLRWDFVYQRPQHIIGRMAENMKILFVEEPVLYNASEVGTYNLNKITENLHVLQPKVAHIESIADLLNNYLNTPNSIRMGWFYSASFAPLLSHFKFDIIVYDCMDELALFKFAPQQIIDQEKYMIAHSDVVFTGGKSLFEAKSKMHENVYCFPSSVDESHFATALNGIMIPEDIAHLPKPIVGYFGVIDERIDLELIDQTAQKMPYVSFVMIGPLAKISEDDLPRRANIHYTGMKNYDELPNYLKGFDLAMMPFAMNDATKFISPTKTLEYMAAGKPIISTRITDVLRDYSDCVSFADDAEEFAEQIELLLQESYKLSTISRYREILDNTSWDNTVRKMKSILNEIAR